MNRRTLWVFLVPVLIAIALGPTVTSVTSGPRESRVLVSATPLYVGELPIILWMMILGAKPPRISDRP